MSFFERLQSLKEPGESDHHFCTEVGIPWHRWFQWKNGGLPRLNTLLETSVALNATFGTNSIHPAWLAWGPNYASKPWWQTIHTKGDAE